MVKRYRLKTRFYVILALMVFVIAAGSVAVVDSRSKDSAFCTDHSETRVEYSLLTAEARDLIERVVAAEARGESLEGMAAVAQSIRDRAGAWHMSYAEVVKQPYQYADPYEGEISQDVKKAVEAVFDNNYRVFGDELVLFFFNPDTAAPEWADNVNYLGTIGQHQFYN